MVVSVALGTEELNPVGIEEVPAAGCPTLVAQRQGGLSAIVGHGLSPHHPIFFIRFKMIAL
jgi:hypothetical protein